MAEGFAVQTRQLTKTFQAGDQDLTVLRGVDLDIKRGEFVSIMGPSGSGKSTLLNLVGLLDVPSSGAIRLMGTDTGGMAGNERARMRGRTLGFVFQSFNLMPRLTALHNVMLPMAIAGIPRKVRLQKARDLLASVSLSDRMDHRPSQLSGGQKQRVAIARALALDPPILLADEPTGNLDSKTSLEVMQLFSRLNREGKTILQVTHDEDMAEYGKRIVRFRDGRIVQQERKVASDTTFDEPSFFLAHPRPWLGTVREGKAAPTAPTAPTAPAAPTPKPVAPRHLAGDAGPEPSKPRRPGGR